ncbi:putative acyltransferase (DUF342 family) [Catalinimonas alkaloidigena]|uniref:hypothetical protein n=1 Tax=Catalinimonas alkaloidigena TaxID=1075417 RepID=UPI002406C91F|nr:hypothetical protein [Catalinimonas alkaloidigena]MDF9796534.1 putative acyltransferase (DUF342 family) [Catalinimonas alkaloidigena]
MKALFLASLMLFALWVENPLMEKFQAKEEVSIDNRISHDLYLAGSSIKINAPVEGDVMAAGGTVMISDSIERDLVLAGGELIIEGAIGEDLLVMGGNVTIQQSIMGDLIVMGGNVSIDESVSIGQDLIVMAGQVRSEANVSGNILARGGTLYLGGACKKMLDVQGGNIDINGTVRGEAKLASETISIGNEAKFYSNVYYWAEDAEHVDFGPSLMNGVQAQYDVGLELSEEAFWTSSPWSWIPLMLVYFGSVLLLIFLMHMLLPKVMEKSGNILLAETARSFGYGVLYYIGAPLAIILLMMTVIGIPLGLFSLFLYIFSVLFSLTLSAVIIAYLIKEHYHYAWRRAMLIAVSFVIFILLRALSLIPFLGFVIVGLIVGAAVGALILSFFPGKQTSLTPSV